MVGGDGHMYLIVREGIAGRHPGGGIAFTVTKSAKVVEVWRVVT